MKKIILDLDIGVDDCLAIAYALGSPELELIGITGTYGNVLLDTGTRNALDLLDMFGKPEVPVFSGIPHAREKDSFEVLEISKFIHGVNGIGDVEIPHSGRKVEEQCATDFMVDSVKKYGDDLVIVATGPMTNLAKAIEKDPTFQDNAHVVIMGGALTVPGNCNAVMEANISQDPEAADLLFRSRTRVTMIGLDVTLQTLLTYKETQVWRNLGTPAATALADITDFYIKAYETTAPYLGGCGLHDPLAVAVAVDPSLVTLFDCNLKVDLEEPVRGRTICDEKRLNDPNKNVKAAITVDVNRFLKEFMERITSMLKGIP